MSKNLTRGSGGPQFRFDAPRLIPITNMIAAPHSTLPPVPSLKPKNALDAIGSALEERNSDIPPPHKRAMTKAAQNSANISGDTPVIGSRNAPQSSEGDWPKKVVMTAAASLMGSSTFSSHGPAAITTTPLMHTPPTTVKSLQASSHQAFRGPSDTAKIETGPTTSKDTAVGHSPKPLIATATANSIDKTTQSAIMTLTASEAALQELTLIVEQLTVKLEQEKLKNEQMRPKVERLERVQNEMSIISHRLEVLDEERERRRFLGTSTSMVPYTVNISCRKSLSCCWKNCILIMDTENGFRGKVQVYPAMSGADLIRRIRCKAGVDQFASEHIAVKMGDEQLAQIATMTEQGVLQESELTVSWTA